MIRRVLLDTSGIIALLSEQDEHHRACCESLDRIASPLLTCWPVVTEALYLLQQRGASVNPLFAAFEKGLFKLLQIDEPELARIQRIMTKYRSIHLQIADASLAYLAERETPTHILTLDRRDFSVVRVAKRTLSILPD